MSAITRTALSVGMKGVVLGVLLNQRYFAQAAPLPTTSKVNQVAISSITSYVSQFPSPGFMIFPNKKIGVESNLDRCANDFSKMKALETLADPIEGNLSRNILSQIRRESATDTYGVRLGVNGERVIYGMNPKKVDNAKLSMDYLQEKLGSGEDFWKSPQGEMTKILQKVHEISFDHISTDITVGHFRINNLIVHTREDYEDRANPHLILARHQGTREDHAILEKVIDRMKKARDFNDAMDSLTPREEEVLSKIGYKPPARKEVDRLMQEFEKEFKELYYKTKEKGSVDYIKLAAFAHQRIVAIHPFDDGNGRVARAVMNSLLIQGGYCPVIFLSDDEYTQAIETSQKEHSIDFFETYLRRCIKTTKVAFKNMLSTAKIPLSGKEDAMSLPIHSGYPPKL